MKGNGTGVITHDRRRQVSPCRREWRLLLPLVVGRRHVAMPVPVSNYTASILKDPTGTGIYAIGGRDVNGAIINTVQVYYPSTNTS